MLAIAVLVVGAGGCSSPDPAASILYTSEVVLPGVAADSNAIARMPNGDFVVAGSIGAGWAAATDAHGKLLWQYVAPREERPPYSTSSEFSGVVPLANGNILLCGKINTSPQVNGYLVILDGAGHLVEERRLSPKDGPGYRVSTLRDCVRWDDGVAVVGSTEMGEKGYGWILKLDGNGRKLWELIDANLGTDKAVVMPYGLVTSGLDLSVVSSDAKVTARRVLVDSPAHLLRRLRPDGVLRVITYRPEGATLHLLDKNLQELEVHKVGAVMIDEGVGYVLRDDSLALFGRIHLPDGSFTAAVGHFTSQGAGIAARTIGVRNGAPTVNDALPLTGNDFVAVRDQTTDAEHVVLTWITFK